jgi:hypothetical protein
MCSYRSWCCLGAGYKDDVNKACENNNEENDDNESSSSKTGAAFGVIWKVFFYLCCFPVCYPCYVTRFVNDC